MGKEGEEAFLEGRGKSEQRRTKCLSVVALLLWLGGPHMNVVVAIACFLALPVPWACAALAVWLTNIFLPLFMGTRVADAVPGFIARYAPLHFPMELHVEDMAAFDPSRAYVLAAEPHGVLPFGIVLLTPHYGQLPLPKMKALATTVIFWTPILRHVWSWLGLVPASRATFTGLLRDGYSAIIVPGGVQEVIYLERDQETIFLERRHGFLRCAIEAGAPVVPCFCFGQSEVYSFWKPKGAWFTKLARMIGFAPFVYWGMYGTPVPYPKPMYFVVGKPIEVEKIANPSVEQIVPVQRRFIAEMEQLFERHKASAGYESLTLTVK